MRERIETRFNHSAIANSFMNYFIENYTNKDGAFYQYVLENEQEFYIYLEDMSEEIIENETLVVNDMTIASYNVAYKNFPEKFQKVLGKVKVLFMEYIRDKFVMTEDHMHQVKIIPVASDLQMYKDILLRNGGR